MIRAKHLVLGLAGLLALAGTPVVEARGNICVDACLAPYVDANAVTSAAKTACSRACRAVNRQRKTCLNEVTTFWNTQINTCKKNLKGGQLPITVTSTLTTTYTGTPQQTQFSLVMNGTCVADLNSAKADFVQTCKELLCPGKQYWDMSKNACINAPLNPPGAGAAAAPAPDPLPATIRGFFKFSWESSKPYQGPIDTNIGVTFTGWTLDNTPEANIPPVTNRALNFLSYGGGNLNGAWSIARVQAVGASSNLDAVTALGYDGIVIDAEESTEVIPVSEWNAMFDAVKAKNLILVVTVSHFAPYAMANGQQLAADWLQNPRIDVLSPQLYTTGSELQNDWTGYSAAWKNAVPRIAPAIVQPWYYDRLGSNSVIDPQWLPNATGYFVWSNTPAHNLGASNSNCYSFTLGTGTGCAWMCDQCATKLGTNNYYFTDSACTYVAGQGCQGNPWAGYTYTCCRA